MHVVIGKMEVEIFRELWNLGVNALIFIGVLTVIYAILQAYLGEER